MFFMCTYLHCMCLHCRRLHYIASVYTASVYTASVNTASVYTASVYTASVYIAHCKRFHCKRLYCSCWYQHFDTVLSNYLTILFLCESPFFISFHWLFPSRLPVFSYLRQWMFWRVDDLLPVKWRKIFTCTAFEVTEFMGVINMPLLYRNQFTWW